MIGKPDSGKLTVRFDEGELEIEPLWLLRQFSTLLEHVPDRNSLLQVFAEETCSVCSFSKQIIIKTIHMCICRLGSATNEICYLHLNPLPSKLSLKGKNGFIESVTNL
jgi:hypothetical protein